MTRDPVSWLLVEPGWAVYDARQEVGKVDEVLGDEPTRHLPRPRRRRRGDPRRAGRGDPRGRDPLARRAPRGLPAPAAATESHAVRKLLWTGLYGALAAVATMAARRVASEGLARRDGREAAGEAMKGDRAVDAGADEARRARGQGRRQGRPRPASSRDELADDAAFLRKLKPSLIASRAKGEAPNDAEPGAAAAGARTDAAELRAEVRRQAARTRSSSRAPRSPSATVLAKMIDWRGHAHPAALRVRASAPRRSRSPSMRARSRRLELELAGLELKQKAGALGSAPGSRSARRCSCSTGSGSSSQRSRSRSRGRRHLARRPARGARLLVFAGIAGSFSWRALSSQRGTPPVPEQAIREAKLTSEALKANGHG